MRNLPQSEHCDLGIVDDDNTPDMRKAPAATEALQNNHPITALERGQSMTSLSNIADPGVPDGGEPDLWVGGQRDVYCQIGHVAVHPDLLRCPAITVVAEQRVNGSLGKVEVVLDVAMTRSSAELTPAQARELAALLVAGADLADTWAGVPAAGRRDYDLLQDMPLPPGITAGEWSIDEDGHLYRELSDGRRQRGYGEIYGELSVPGQLSAAKAALLSLYDVVRAMPGNAGDYVRAALDSVADAQAVLR